VFDCALINLNAEQMRVTWISCFLASVIFKYFDDCTVFSMETLMIGVSLIRNIDPNPISNLKSSH